MRIVIDTNVLCSALFFGGSPAVILKSVIRQENQAIVTDEILIEYHEIINRLKQKYGRQYDVKSASDFLAVVNHVNSKTKVEICRDPDDDKFLEAAIDGKAIYIVSGDQDLLSIKTYQDVEIVTPKEFIERYLG